MAEVEELCDRVAIVRSGRVVYEGALDALIASTAGRFELRTTDNVRAAEIAERRVAGVELGPAGLTFNAEERAVAELSFALAEAGVGIVALVPRTATLEELFFRMTEGTNGRVPAEEVVA
jgi:ABC-2 type transport system ATP-binding protein